jgi:hypothetical protein
MGRCPRSFLVLPKESSSWESRWIPLGLQTQLTLGLISMVSFAINRNIIYRYDRFITKSLKKIS